MKAALSPAFSFPGGSVAEKAVSSCLDLLEEAGKGAVSRERIIDFCICQVYAIQGFGDGYLKRWKVCHSFGKKALERFDRNHSRKKHYEDVWLKEHKLSRAKLLEFFADKKEHPLKKFLFPEYEEKTKGRLHNTEAGFCVCLLSTLLYTPFSLSCQKCKHSKRCICILEKKHGELYRIRMEEFTK